jgi:hypothetical protein
MSETDVSERKCGLCDKPLTGDEGGSPCRVCWEIQIAHTHVSAQISQTLNVMAEYRQAFELGKSISKLSPSKEGFQMDHDLGVLRDYAQELASLRSLRARQRELCLKLNLRRSMKKDG